MSLAGQIYTETDRLAALNSYEVLDTGSEKAFDDLVRLAARLTRSPIALVSFVDAERQWFKANYGLTVTETHRNHSFCAHAILSQDEPLVVGDATADPRFQSNPLVTGAPHIRAYLGVPLVNAEGHALGSFCVIDCTPRNFEAETLETMRTLASAVLTNLELRRSMLRMRDAAMTDSLTGLPNRRLAMSALADMTAQSTPVAVIPIDLDHLKEVNDSRGHAAGDALLQVAANRLKQAVRPGDIVARIGGDEFVTLLTGVTDRDVVAAVTERISNSLSHPVQFGPGQLQLGATLGVAIVPEDVASHEMALRVADEALLRAKKQRRGSIGRASQEDTRDLLRAAAIVRAFDADAAGGDSFKGATVHLQPIVTLSSASGIPAVVGVEALSRWYHPDVGDVPPDELIPAIGLNRTSHLGQEIRRLALVAFAELRTMGPANTYISLNLSAAEVYRADIALHITEQVERAGLSLRSLQIEITEEVLLDRVSNRTLDQLAALRGRGARLVLDDFGTGTAELARLLRIPLDGLKLDKQFVQRLGKDTRAEEIVRATLSLANGLGLDVVAEGVETDEQAAMLRALGCQFAQGFLFGKPMPPARLRKWLGERVLDDSSNGIALEPRATPKAS